MSWLANFATRTSINDASIGHESLEESHTLRPTYLVSMRCLMWLDDGWWRVASTNARLLQMTGCLRMRLWLHAAAAVLWAALLAGGYVQVGRDVHGLGGTGW